MIDRMTLALLPATLFFLVVCLYSADGQGTDLPLSEWGLDVSIPEGWSVVDTTTGSPGIGEPLYRLAATDSAGQSMTLHIVEAPTWWVVSRSEVQKRIESSMIGEGTMPTSREVVRHAGEEAYRFEGIWERDSVDIRVAGLFLLANGRGYSLSFTTLSKMSPFEHPHVAQIVESFRFLGEVESHIDTDTLEPYSIDRQGVSLVVPGGWQELPIDPETDGSLVIRTADRTRERAIYIERVSDFPAIAPDDSLLVAEMAGRLVRSGFQLTSTPEVIEFQNRLALSLSGAIPGTARGHLLVLPASEEGSGIGTTVMVVVQGEALEGGGPLNDPVVAEIIRSMQIAP